MTTGMPELGSKISLISKADIRYEGRLFTVDPQECTIALASVRSFGTEDRETQYPVPAQNQVYDYILFRGSDIKDIRVVNQNVPHPQPLNDPAIMQLSVPPSLGSQTFQNHPVLGPMGPQLGQFTSGYSGIGGMGSLSANVGTGLGIQRESRNLSGSKPSELIVAQTAPSTVLSPTVEPLRSVNDHASVLDLIGGSRSTTPVSLGSRKSPTNDQGVQTGGAKHDDKKVIKPIQPPSQRNQQRRNSRERKDSRGDMQPFFQNHQGRSSANRNHGNQDGYQRQNYQNQGGQNYHQGNQRNNWSNNRGAMLRPRGRPRGTFRNLSAQNNKTKNTLKFENDFDFEQANTQFEELRSQLGKVKIEEASSSNTKSEVNGDGDKKDDSGNETGAGEAEQDDEHEVYYDKSKSFFDKISCEAVERAKGKSQRTDWRMERKLNSETFGVAATRRGSYRGRGGYRGMNYRGGYRPNYRPPQRRETQPQQQSSQQGNANRLTRQIEKVQTPRNESSGNESRENENDIPTTSMKGVESNSEVSPEPAMAVK